MRPTEPRKRRARAVAPGLAMLRALGRKLATMVLGARASAPIKSLSQRRGDAPRAVEMAGEPAEMERGHMRAKNAVHAAAADVCAVVGARRFLAHADVLRESPVLAEMLDGESLTRREEGDALRVLTLSAEPGAADALAADGFARVLDLLYNPFAAPLVTKEGDVGLSVLLAEDDARVLIPAAHFLGIPSLLALADAGLARHIAAELSWERPASWEAGAGGGGAGGGAPVPRDQELLAYAVRFSLPRVGAAALASVLRVLTRACCKGLPASQSVARALPEPAKTLLLEELLAHSAALRVKDCGCSDQHHVRVQNWGDEAGATEPFELCGQTW